MKKYLLLFLISLSFTNSKSFTHIISVSSSGFSPSYVSINAGDSIRWVLVNGSHIVESGAIPPFAPAFSGNVNANTPHYGILPQFYGVYEYHDALNFSLTGTFEVACDQVGPPVSVYPDNIICSGTTTTITCAGFAQYYQWYRNNSPITGANNSSYDATQSGTYYCNVTNFCGDIFPSQSATITVNPTPSTPVITAQGPTTFCQGGSVVLNTAAVSSYSYQWKKSTININGATTNSYTASVTGSYTCAVSNSCGNATSLSINVTRNALPPAVVSPAGSVTKCSTDTLLLSASVAANLIYQWKRNNVNIAGATHSTYKAVQGGNYRVLVTRTTTGCSKLSAITKITNNCKLEITESENELTLFPNPAIDFVTVSGITSEKTEIKISNLLDQQVKSISVSNVQSTILPVSDLPAGIYVVTIFDGEKIVCKKLVKE